MDPERLVTVEALWPMPGVPDGSVHTLPLTPQLQALIDTGRYRLLTHTTSHEPDSAVSPNKPDEAKPPTQTRRRGTA